MTAYSFLQHLHSGFRYIVLLLVIAAVIASLIGLFNAKPYTKGNSKLNLFTLISAHTQLLIGIVLYFISPLVQFSKAAMHDKYLRYYTAEHWVIMLIGIALITIGYSKSKKALTDVGKHKTISIYYSIALILIFAGIMLIPRG